MAEKKKVDTGNSNQLRQYIDIHKKAKSNLYKKKIKRKLQITGLLSLLFVLAFGIFSPVALTVFFALPLLSVSRDILSIVKFKFLSRNQENVKNEMRDVLAQDNVRNEEPKNMVGKYTNKLRSYTSEVKRMFSNNTKKEHNNSGYQSFFGIVGISLLAIVGVSMMLFGIPYIFVVLSVGVSTAAFASMGAERLISGCHKDIINNAVNFQNIDDKCSKTKLHEAEPISNDIKMDSIKIHKNKPKKISSVKNLQHSNTNIYK